MLSNLISALASGDSALIGSTLVIFLFYLIAILLSLSIHESAHGFVAYRCGDPTAKNLGRITLNPVKHIDPFGFICMMIAGFGWAKPVPVNSRNFNKPRRDMALVSFAGPASNLITALICTAILRFADAPLAKLAMKAAAESNTFVYLLAMSIGQFILILIRLNVTLAVFNLIPMPPLDGSKILYTFLPPKVYFKIAPYEKYLYIIMVILLITDIITPVISVISGGISNFLISLFFW